LDRQTFGRLIERLVKLSLPSALCFALLIAAGLFPSPSVAQPPPSPLPSERLYPDPRRYEQAVLAFEALADSIPTPEGAIVCLGSSSMRLWHRTIQADLTPLTLVPRGFGGSTMMDALYYAERLVIASRPRAVLLYEGDNDIALGISPAMVRRTFDALVAKIHQALPHTRLYVLAIKPSIARWTVWPEMRAANRLLKNSCESNPLLTYIDVASLMLSPDLGRPRPEIFTADSLHMNEKGY